MRRLPTKKRRNSVVAFVVASLLTSMLPAPARGATSAPTDSGNHGSDWKPASERDWWDRLWGLHDSDSTPNSKDLTVGAVPRNGPMPKGSELAPAKRVKELTSRRTANARYYQLSNGDTQAEFSPRPINYRTDEGWKPIDTTVTKTSAGGFATATTPTASAACSGRSRVSWSGSTPVAARR